MNGHEAVIQKILDDYAKEAEKIVSDAENIAAKLIEDTNRLCLEQSKNAEIASEISKKTIMSKKVALADSECKKLMSSAKKSTIDDAFKEAKNDIISRMPEEYKKLIASMITAYAADGDTVIISEHDKDVITAKFIADIAKKLKISLKLSPIFGAFTGGVILSNVAVDKNLSLDLELDLLRENIEPEIAKMLSVAAE